jgi:hypothetical protein
VTVRLCMADVDSLESFHSTRLDVFPDLLLIGTDLAAFDPWTFEALDDLPTIDGEQIAAYWVIGELEFTLLAATSPNAFSRAAAAWHGLLDGPIAVAGPLTDDLAGHWQLQRAVDRVWIPPTWRATAWASETGATVLDV